MVQKARGRRIALVLPSALGTTIWRTAEAFKMTPQSLIVTKLLAVFSPSAARIDAIAAAVATRRRFGASSDLLQRLKSFKAWLVEKGRTPTTAQQYYVRTRAILVEAEALSKAPEEVLESKFQTGDYSDGFYMNARSALRNYRAFEAAIAATPLRRPEVHYYPKSIARIFWRLSQSVEDPHALLQVFWNEFEVTLVESDRRLVLFAGGVVLKTDSDDTARLYVDILKKWGGWERSPNNHRALVFPEKAGVPQPMDADKLLEQIESMHSRGDLDEAPTLDFEPRVYYVKKKIVY